MLVHRSMRTLSSKAKAGTGGGQMRVDETSLFRYTALAPMVPSESLVRRLLVPSRFAICKQTLHLLSAMKLHPAYLQVSPDGKAHLRWYSWLGDTEAVRSRMIVDNMLGRIAPSADNAPDLPAFKEALLLGWQRLDAAIEMKLSCEQFVVVHVHWAGAAAV